jgi:hypothetical protein
MELKAKKIHLVLDSDCEVVCAFETSGDANTYIAETAPEETNDEWEVEDTTLHYWKD